MNSKTSEFLDLLESFLSVYLPCSVGVRPNTIKSYKDAFRLLLCFMYEKRKFNADKILFSDLSYELILDFLSWLEAERGCSAATRNQRLSALSSFSKYAQNRSFEAATVFRSDVKNLPSKKRIHSKCRNASACGISARIYNLLIKCCYSRTQIRRMPEDTGRTCWGRSPMKSRQSRQPRAVLPISRNCFSTSVRGKISRRKSA